MKNLDLNTLYDNYNWGEGKYPLLTLFDIHGSWASENTFEYIYLWANKAIVYYPFMYYDDGREIRHPDNPYPRIAMTELVLFGVYANVSYKHTTLKLYFKSVKTNHFYEISYNCDESESEDSYHPSEFIKEYEIPLPYPFAKKLSKSEDELELGTLAYGKEIYIAERRKYIISKI